MGGVDMGWQKRTLKTKPLSKDQGSAQGEPAAKRIKKDQSSQRGKGKPSTTAKATTPAISAAKAGTKGPAKLDSEGSAYEQFRHLNSSENGEVFRRLLMEMHTGVPQENTVALAGTYAILCLGAHVPAFQAEPAQAGLYGLDVNQALLMSPAKLVVKERTLVQHVIPGGVATLLRQYETGVRKTIGGQDSNAFFMTTRGDPLT
jgi:hypothetical protein